MNSADKSMMDHMGVVGFAQVSALGFFQIHLSPETEGGDKFKH